MCHRVTCKECNKPDWTGCGMHIEEALVGVPPEQRCKCDKVRRCTIFWFYVKGYPFNYYLLNLKNNINFESFIDLYYLPNLSCLIFLDLIFYFRFLSTKELINVWRR